MLRFNCMESILFNLLYIPFQQKEWDTSNRMLKQKIFGSREQLSKTDWGTVKKTLSKPNFTRNIYQCDCYLQVCAKKHLACLCRTVQRWPSPILCLVDFAFFCKSGSLKRHCFKLRSSHVCNVHAFLLPACQQSLQAWSNISHWLSSLWKGLLQNVPAVLDVPPATVFV